MCRRFDPGSAHFFTSPGLAGACAVLSCLAEGKSDKGEGTAQWTGSVNGPRLIASVTWTKADGSILRFASEGKKEAKKP